MAASVPAEDTERVPLSGALALVATVAPALVLIAMAIAGVYGACAPGSGTWPGIVLIALPSIAGLVWWRWGTPLSRVVATRTGLLVSNRRGEWFSPYTAVASVHEGSSLGELRPITVRLRAPADGLRSFVFFPPYSRSLGQHPVTIELARRLAQVSVVASDLSDAEALRAVAAGLRVLCPVCREPAAAIPRGWSGGEPLRGIECPRSSWHYALGGEDGKVSSTVEAPDRSREPE